MTARITLVVAVVLSTSAVGRSEGPVLNVDPMDAFAEVLDRNRTGDRLLQREVAENEFALSLLTFIQPSESDELLRVPILEQFTTVSAFHLSDVSEVVGFATRPLRDPRGSQRAFIWNWKQPSASALPLPASFRGSCAFDISADGTTVSGFVLGAQPPRISPCVWRRQEGQWEHEFLPCPSVYNPFLSSGKVVVSADGNVVAASVLRGPGLGTGNQLMIWRRDQDGAWIGKAAGNYAVRIADVTNMGVVAGTITQRGKRRGLVSDPQTGIHVVAPLEGDTGLDFLDVNEHGEVVGNSDDPPGPEGGTVAVRWDLARKQLEAVDFRVPSIFSTATTINDQGEIAGWISYQSDNDKIVAGPYELSPQAAQP